MTIAEMAARLSHYEGLERELDEAAAQAAGKENVGGGADASDVSASVDGLSALSGAVPASLRRRLRRAVSPSVGASTSSSGCWRPRRLRATPRWPRWTSWRAS